MLPSLKWIADALRNTPDFLIYTGLLLIGLWYVQRTIHSMFEKSLAKYSMDIEYNKIRSEKRFEKILQFADATFFHMATIESACTAIMNAKPFVQNIKDPAFREMVGRNLREIESLTTKSSIYMESSVANQIMNWSIWFENVNEVHISDDIDYQNAFFLFKVILELWLRYLTGVVPLDQIRTEFCEGILHYTGEQKYLTIWTSFDNLNLELKTKGPNTSHFRA